VNYDEMAEALGVTRCRGRTPSGHRCHEQHDKEGSITDDIIHFSERPYQRPDTLAFLKLVARSQEPSIDADEPWRRVYRLNLKVRFLARFLHIRNPAGPARADRAFVLAGVAPLSNDVPLRKQAFDWARSSPKRKEDGT
jgi:hypothetical protein